MLPHSLQDYKSYSSISQSMGRDLNMNSGGSKNGSCQGDLSAACSWVQPTP